MKTVAVAALKRGLLLYWSLWCTVVFAMQALEALQDLGVIGNGALPLIDSARLAYGRPAGLRGVWRLGVIAWEAAAAVVFWMAFRSYRERKLRSPRPLAAAFILALGLYGAVAILDRVVAGPSHEATHLLILIGLLASLLVVFFLPE
jgi:hypothetical protein